MSEKFGPTVESKVSIETLNKFMNFIQERATSPQEPGDFSKGVKRYNGTYRIEPEEGQLVASISIDYSYFDNSEVALEDADDAELAISAGFTPSTEREVLALLRSGHEIRHTAAGSELGEDADDAFVNDLLEKIEALEANGKAYAE